MAYGACHLLLVLEGMIIQSGKVVVDVEQKLR